VSDCTWPDAYVPKEDFDALKAILQRGLDWMESFQPTAERPAWVIDATKALHPSAEKPTPNHPETPDSYPRCAAHMNKIRCDLVFGHDGLHCKFGQIPETTIHWRVGPIPGYTVDHPVGCRCIGGDHGTKETR